MSWKCRKCQYREHCWARVYCKATCDTCECPFDWTMTCESCKNTKCEKRGSRPRKEVAEWIVPPR